MTDYRWIDIELKYLINLWHSFSWSKCVIRATSYDVSKRRTHNKWLRTSENATKTSFPNSTSINTLTTQHSIVKDQEYLVPRWIRLYKWATTVLLQKIQTISIRLQDLTLVVICSSSFRDPKWHRRKVHLSEGPQSESLSCVWVELLQLTRPPSSVDPRASSQHHGLLFVHVDLFYLRELVQFQRRTLQ